MPVRLFYAGAGSLLVRYGIVNALMTAIALAWPAPGRGRRASGCISGYRAARPCGHLGVFAAIIPAAGICSLVVGLQRSHRLGRLALGGTSRAGGGGSVWRTSPTALVVSGSSATPSVPCCSRLAALLGITAGTLYQALLRPFDLRTGSGDSICHDRLVTALAVAWFSFPHQTRRPRSFAWPVVFPFPQRHRPLESAHPPGQRR